LQPKILRVIQERQFERLGGGATIHTDVRLICATHRNLAAMIEERQFRPDLFYRLGVFPIELPPLRDRPEDIRLLVHHFAMDYAARMHKPIKAISEEFTEALVRHSWPGNVRELQNFIERSVILSIGAVLNGSPPELTYTKFSAPVTMEEAERSHILQTLQQTKGVIAGRSGAAARLGLPRTTLISRMKRLGINPAQSSSAHARAAASVPISGNSKPQSDLEREFTLADAERQHISEVVEITNGLIEGEGGAAEVLGVPPSTLRYRIKKLGIKP
jgi:formate hydrogenlyase transcriptional activator